MVLLPPLVAAMFAGFTEGLVLVLILDERSVLPYAFLISMAGFFFAESAGEVKLYGTSQRKILATRIAIVSAIAALILFGGIVSVSTAHYLGTRFGAGLQYWMLSGLVLLDWTTKYVVRRLT